MAKKEKNDSIGRRVLAKLVKHMEPATEHPAGDLPWFAGAEDRLTLWVVRQGVGGIGASLDKDGAEMLNKIVRKMRRGKGGAEDAASVMASSLIEATKGFYGSSVEVETVAALVSAVAFIADSIANEDGVSFLDLAQSAVEGRMRLSSLVAAVDEENAMTIHLWPNRADAVGSNVTVH